MTLHEFARILLEMPDDPEVDVEMHMMERKEDAPPETPLCLVKGNVSFYVPTREAVEQLNQKMLMGGAQDLMLPQAAH